MRIVLDIRKSLEENAQRYFEAAKKSRRKAKGAEKAITDWKARLARQEAPAERKAAAPKRRKKEWYEKLRWCRSSEGFLLIGGRDAATNELVIKRHTVPGDVVFHTDMAGSTFVVVKAEKQKVGEATMTEAAQMTACFSRAWKNGLSSLEVFHVAPEQVTKEAQAGESLPRGAFMIRGKTLYHKPLLKLAIGLDADGRVMVGPPDAVKKHCAKAYEVIQGNGKASDVAKALKQEFGVPPDDIIAALPAGGCVLGKELK